MMTEKPTNTFNTFTINIDNWEGLKKKFKEKFPDLVDFDLEYEEGKIEDMIDRVQAKIGRTIERTKEGLHKFIESL